MGALVGGIIGGVTGIRKQREAEEARKESIRIAAEQAALAPLINPDGSAFQFTPPPASDPTGTIATSALLGAQFGSQFDRKQTTDSSRNVAAAGSNFANQSTIPQTQAEREAAFFGAPPQ